MTRPLPDRPGYPVDPTALRAFLARLDAIPASDATARYDAVFAETVETGGTLARASYGVPGDGDAWHVDLHGIGVARTTEAEAICAWITFARAALHRHRPYASHGEEFAALTEELRAPNSRCSRASPKLDPLDRPHPGGRSQTFSGARTMIRHLILPAIALGMAAPVAILLATGAGAATLDAFITTDPLGFPCIEEAKLEPAFAATGKKDAHLPRTCLPRPCDRMLDRAAFARLLGRDPTDGQWSDYVSRYADFCRDETRGAWLNEGVGADTSIARSASFWTPLLIQGPVRNVVAPKDTILPPVIVVQSPPATIAPPEPPPTAPFPPVTILPPVIAPPPCCEPPRPPDPTPPLTPVPLPATLPMLALACLALRGMRR